MKTLTNHLINSKLTLVIFLMLSSILYGQVDYQISLVHYKQLGNDSFLFDVYIKSTDSDFQLTSYQCALILKSESIDGESISFNYVPGSSELTNAPSYSNGFDQSESNIKIKFASNAGNDLISSSNLKIGRFILKGVDLNSNILPEINWCFDGAVSTIITGENFVDISNPVNHIDLGSQNNMKRMSKTNDHSEEDDNNSTPERFELQQNYPNPFNPSTTIKFQMASTGTHSVVFDASRLASGAYVYLLNVEDQFTATKKMLLLK
jgi:hypothetical protein